MHIFLSAGEPSGDLHAANLARELRRRSADVRLSGFGGERASAAGCELLFPLCDHAVMGLGQVVRNLPTFARLLDRAEDYFRAVRPDAVVMIDYPGFHWELARRARRVGVPVYYFVPPQIWAWATWRVAKMRRLTDRVLCALPFEYEWFRGRGVNAEYVGHPYFDELAERRLDARRIGEIRGGGSPLVALLPGSRRQEIANNLPMMLAAARRLRGQRPDARFVIASLNQRQAELARSFIGPDAPPVEIRADETPEVIEAATACVAVSGSVSLELMYALKPTVVVYRTTKFWVNVARPLLLRCHYITLVNLLAGRELYPEYLTVADRSGEIAARVLHWLDDEGARSGLEGHLRNLRDEVARPGACRRAAEVIHGDLTTGRAAGSVA